MMQQTQIPLFILTTGLIALVYQETMFLKLFLEYRRKGSLKSAEIVKIFQIHDANPLYKIRIKGLNLPYSKHHLKITILSSFFPRFMKREFRVYYLENSDRCVVANPMMLIIDWILICLFIFLIYKLF
jgi:hypothetical protein